MRIPASLWLQTWLSLNGVLCLLTINWLLLCSIDWFITAILLKQETTLIALKIGLNSGAFLHAIRGALLHATWQIVLLLWIQKICVKLVLTWVKMICTICWMFLILLKFMVHMNGTIRLSFVTGVFWIWGSTAIPTRLPTVNTKLFLTKICVDSL